MAYEIVPIMYDVNTVEFAVKNTVTGRYEVEGCHTIGDAEQELEAILAHNDAVAAGPFSTAQCEAKR